MFFKIIKVIFFKYKHIIKNYIKFKFIIILWNKQFKFIIKILLLKINLEIKIF